MWQRSRRWSRFPGPAKADQESELGAPGGRLELFQRLRPRAGNRTGGMGGAGLGGVCIFQDLGFLPPFLLWAWAELPEGSGVGGIRYLGISGRAPGGSHLPSYLGLGRGEEEAGEAEPRASCRGRLRACPGPASPSSLMGPRLPFCSHYGLLSAWWQAVTLPEPFCPPPLTPKPGALGLQLRDWPLRPLPGFKPFRLVTPREGFCFCSFYFLFF